jgi:uncharacterized SAM-binding protein YcdF (DUF218 family)
MSIGAVLVGLAICLAVLLSDEAILPILCGWLDVGEEPDCAEHVLVLPGDPTYRPLVAAALVKAGLVRTVLIPETYLSADVKDGLTPPTASVLRRVVESRGVPSEDVVLLEGESRTTFGDARALLRFLQGRPQDRVIVVTNAFHTRRARFIFRRVLGREADRLRFVAAPNPGFADHDWWKHRSGASTVLSENLKLGFYRVRYSSVRDWTSVALLIGIALLLRRQQRKHRPPVPRPSRPAPAIGHATT